MQPVGFYRFLVCLHDVSFFDVPPCVCTSIGELEDILFNIMVMWWIHVSTLNDVVDPCKHIQ
jgi:hypothetical protein